MWLFWTVLLLETLSGAEIDLFVPSFPEMQEVFQLNVFQVELTLAVNLIAHFFACLVVGHLGDRYGRRPIILLGLVIFMLSSLLCVYAPNFEWLLVGRFFQGIGVAGPAVLSYLLISDAYPIEKQQYLMGVANGVINAAVAFAPVVGSYVALYFHWEGNFIALFLLALSCFAMTCITIPVPIRLSGGGPSQKLKNPTRFSLKEYQVVFQSPKALYASLTFVFLCLGYWVFIAISPVLYMEGLGVPLKHFGLYQGAIAAFFSVGSFLTPWFLKKFKQETCFKVGMWSNILCMLVIFIFALYEIQNPIWITTVMVLDSISMVLPVIILFPLALETLPEAKGKISACIVSGRLIGMAFFVQLTSYFYVGTFRSLGLVLVAITLIGLFFYYKLLQIDPKFLSTHKK